MTNIRLPANATTPQWKVTFRIAGDNRRKQEKTSMKTIAVAFAAMLALGAAMPAAQAAQNGGSTPGVAQADGATRPADELSSRHRHWHGHRYHGRHWHGYRRWHAPRHRHCWHTWRHGRRIVVCR
jgi:hypothetical protein